MTKEDLIIRVSNEAGVSKACVKRVIESVNEALISELCDTGKFVIHGVGRFNVKHRAARTMRNPQNGDPIEVSARKAVTFSASKSIKDRLNGGGNAES
ncbi:HU family DNA-binding protein [Thiopseudomonas alkaliphila]|uniref:HU family DNA-binding protein n=1 Tax=Thiopseudomonas alkaliphila TaxID=1697053 RepID=A0AAW7DUU0_9GAMM|nr:HU family DNA-binding protein [Thiopseudomonas alkaliphila]MDM1697135.1 HU family DNA-binding protein [Thiopseudomonas alkaliphila]